MKALRTIVAAFALIGVAASPLGVAASPALARPHSGHHRGLFHHGQSLSSSVDTTSNPVVIHQSMGGRIDAFEQEFAAIRAHGQQVVVDGDCVSACTMVLGLPPGQVCATDRARFGFHMAWTPGPFGQHIPDQRGTWQMARYWPRYVSVWLKQHGGLTPDVKLMPATDVFPLLRRCR